ncbi:MAG: chromosomal replication initiator protein DnaA [Planctomycetaceae bacterium]|nr:chromosomal replication initiator protein DnaA [Planctomycetaceae bacterium]MBT6484658.1 chromosomal replication initiator protein DnaA [Planctomycetaceae bacterium]MBT6493926.1 chromosomal replication initiator protein DnaA [Planctomycetaceae bacterium]
MQPATPAMVQPNDPTEVHFFEQLQRTVGERNFDHWFNKKITLACDGEQLSIGVGSPFLLTWMQKQFHRPLTEVAQSTYGPAVSVRLQVDSSLVLTDKSETNVSPKKPKNKSPKTAERQTAQRTTGSRTPQSRRFADLAEFVPGSSNELALTASRQVCEAPGEKFNPLFLHGGVGIGKTHLLEGIYRSVRREFPQLQVMYLTSEAFTNFFTQALREHTLPSFRRRFRNVDVLLVDDIDFLESKRAIQEEFLHTFKQLESHGRQIVLTSDRHPRLLTKMSDELTTRCLSGLVCRIESPQLETRRKIVKFKAARLKTEITPEALNFIAERFRNNVRELEGALNCLSTFSHMTGKRVGVTAARRVLADLERDCIRVVRMTDVEQAVSRFFGVPTEDLKSSRRHRSVSRPRMLAMFLARKLTQAAYSEIGQYFGGRNHSTVMSAERNVKGWLEQGTPIDVASQSWPLEDVLEALEQQLMAG